LGFVGSVARRGKPRIFVSNGTRDRVLPVAQTSRRIVQRLQRDGYDVEYREFNGPHTVPDAVVREAFAWLAGRPPSPRTMFRYRTA
jgi:phospholipase/carboxylesterase